VKALPPEEGIETRTAPALPRPAGVVKALPPEEGIETEKISFRIKGQMYMVKALPPEEGIETFPISSPPINTWNRGEGTAPRRGD